MSFDITPENTARLNELLTERIKLLDELKNKGEEEASLLQRQLSHLEDKIVLEKEIAANRTKRLDELIEEMKLLEDRKAGSKEEVEYNEILLEYAKLLLEEEKSRKGENQERVKELKKELEEQTKIYEKIKESHAKEEQKKITLKEIKQGLGAITGEYGKQILNQFSLNGLLSQFSEMVSEVVRTNEQLVKTTGQIGLLSTQATENMGKFGVGYKEMGESFGTLYTNMTTFSNLNRQVQVDLAQDAAKMVNLGVSTETTAKNWDVLNKSFKMSATEAAATTNKIAAAMQGAGIAPAKALNEFSSMMPQLGAHGKKAVDVFIQLEKQSKALGMEMSSLSGIVGETFDTFAGGAEAAGRLNAILGGDYLNSVEMLNATESERVEILRRSFEMSGKNFDSLERYEKKSIAASLGLKDVNEAAKLFGTISIEDRIAMEKQTAQQKELEEAQIASASATRQMQMALSEFYRAAEPVAKILKDIMTWLAEHPKFVSAAASVALLIGVFKMFMPVAGVAINLFKGLGLSIFSAATKTAAAGPVAGQGITGFAQTAKSAVPVVLAFGAAMLMVGAAIYLASSGVARLVESFSKLSNEQAQAAVTTIMYLSIAFGGLALALVLVGALGTAAAIPLLALGAAALMIGGGIYLAATGVTELVKALGTLTTGNAATAAVVLGQLAISIMSLSMALASFALGGIAGFVGLIALKATIKGLEDAVSKAEGLKALTDTINVAATSGDKLEPATRFITTAKEYYIAQKDSKQADNDALVQALKKAIPSGTTPSSGGDSKGTPVILRIENGPDLRAYVLGVKASVF